jgi:hypothetical protein
MKLIIAARLCRKEDSMHVDDSETQDNLIELTNEAIAQVAGGMMKAGPAPTNPDPVVYGYPDGPFGY